MKTIRIEGANWRPDGDTLVHTGDYRIPLDMSEELAERAVAEGAAVEVMEQQIAVVAPPAKKTPAKSAAKD